jgi:hypothetical protein
MTQDKKGVYIIINKELWKAARKHILNTDNHNFSRFIENLIKKELEKTSKKAVEVK